MTSKKSTPEAEDILHRDRDHINKSRNFKNSKSNFEESQPTEEDPCLPINNGTNSTNKSKQSFLDNSIDKKQTDYGENEKDKKIYFSDDALLRSKTTNNKLSFREKSVYDKRESCHWSRFEFETKMRKKFGLTHYGFLVVVLLACAMLFLLLVIAILGGIWPRIPHSQMYPICTKSACFSSSALILSRLDNSKSPCDDFYGFSCGGWIKTYSEPPPGRSRWGIEEEMDLKLSEIILEVISVLPHQTRTNSLTWKIKNFYDSCMSMDNIETDNERPLKKIITELGGWSVLRNFQVLSWDFSKTLVKLHDEYGLTPFFSVSTAADPRNATKNILKLTPSGLGLSDTSYYYRSKDDKISSSYCRYMRDVARQLGATSTDANSFSEDMFYFERRIAEATPPLADLDDIRKHEIHTVTAMKILAPSVPLQEILDAIYHKANINDNTEILVTSSFYFNKISNIIATTDRSALNNYVIWNLVKKYLPYLSQNFQDIYSVYTRETTGTSDPVERWEFCIKTLGLFMDFGLAAQIEKSRSKAETKQNVETVERIFESIRKVVRDSVVRAPWVDLDLYKHFIQKLDNVTVQVGLPESLLDPSYLEEYYYKLHVQKNNFFQNILYGVSFLKENKRRGYVNPTEEYKWLSMVSSETKVKFIPSANKVIIPQKLLHKPYYDPHYPLPILYGTLGVQISRELVSSLLRYSGLYHSNGSLVPDGSLVANLTLTSVDHQLNCLIRLCVENGIVTKVRANRTSLSTFAAISAIRQSLKAMKRVTYDFEHVHQAGLESYDDEGLFFIALGQSLFNQKTEQEADKDITVGTALNGDQLLRVVGLQLKSFAEAFGCSLPSNSCKHIL